MDNYCPIIIPEIYDTSGQFPGASEHRLESFTDASVRDIQTFDMGYAEVTFISMVGINEDGTYSYEGTRVSDESMSRMMDNNTTSEMAEVDALREMIGSHIEQYVGAINEASQEAAETICDAGKEGHAFIATFSETGELLAVSMWDGNGFVAATPEDVQNKSSDMFAGQIGPLMEAMEADETTNEDSSAEKPENGGQENNEGVEVEAPDVIETAEETVEKTADKSNQNEPAAHQKDEANIGTNDVSDNPAERDVQAESEKRAEEPSFNSPDLDAGVANESPSPRDADVNDDLDAGAGNRTEDIPGVPLPASQAPDNGDQQAQFSHPDGLSLTESHAAQEESQWIPASENHQEPAMSPAQSESTDSSAEGGNTENQSNSPWDAVSANPSTPTENQSAPPNQTEVESALSGSVGKSGDQEASDSSPSSGGSRAGAAVGFTSESVESGE